MAKKTDKKSAIRQEIIDSARVYSEKMLVEDKHKIIPEGIRHLIKDDFEKTKKGSFKNKARIKQEKELEMIMDMEFRQL